MWLRRQDSRIINYHSYRTGDTQPCNRWWVVELHAAPNFPYFTLGKLVTHTYFTLASGPSLQVHIQVHGPNVHISSSAVPGEYCVWMDGYLSLLSSEHLEWAPSRRQVSIYSELPTSPLSHLVETAGYPLFSPRPPLPTALILGI